MAGQHLIFAHPGDTVPNKAGIAPGLDLRGDGGLHRHPALQPLIRFNLQVEKQR